MHKLSVIKSKGNFESYDLFFISSSLAAKTPLSRSQDWKKPIPVPWYLVVTPRKHLLRRRFIWKLDQKIAIFDKFAFIIGCFLKPFPHRVNLTRWSGDVIRRTGMKNFNAVSHNRARPYFRIQHGRGEVRARRVYLNVHSVTGNVVDTEWSVEFWRWKYCREFGNNT